MNETALLKSKVLVKHTVRPVRACLASKKKMREELLAHVTGIFDEELAKCGDEQAVLTQVEKRFGDPSELSRTLQESVSARDRSAFLFERWIERRAGESLIRRAVRFGMMSFVAEAGAFVALSLLFPFFWKSYELGTFISLAMLLSIGCGGIMFTSTLLINGLEKVLFRGAGRSRSGASLLVVASTAAPLVLYLVFVSTTSFLFVPVVPKTIDLPSLGRILSAAVLFTCILVWLAYQSSIERRHREEWAALRID